jgi:hypothetical protein
MTSGLQPASLWGEVPLQLIMANPAQGPAFSPDGHMLATAGHDGRARSPSLMGEDDVNVHRI